MSLCNLSPAFNSDTGTVVMVNLSVLTTAAPAASYDVIILLGNDPVHSFYAI
ncbi:hypothetical protein C1A50_0010 [Paenibacillus polymyxa]|nr:hypothetical protein C1A50_0010 [Paenibacillus polymyxa]